MHTTHTTRLIGILGHPRGENLLHQMFSAAADITGADVACLLFDTQVKDLATPLQALQTLNAAGVYLTGRLRSPGSGLVDFLSDEAHGAGIINTVTFDGDQSTGHNTEARAIIDVLEPHRDRFAGGGAVILGGGAMARSAAYVVVRHFRVKYLTIADRTMQQAQVLKQHLTGKKSDTRIEAHELFPPDLADVLAEARLIINATSSGAYPNAEETPITLPDIFHNRQIVLDTIYSPAVTRLLEEAQQGGATTIGGIEILLRQVGLAFELLTGVEFPAEEIHALLVTNEKGALDDDAAAMEEQGEGVSVAGDENASVNAAGGVNTPAGE
jgi:shikimate dehydrogenase